MNITVFTSNQPRHIALIKCLSEIAEELYAVQEVNTVFPGKVQDSYKRSVIMQTYFSKVIKAEKEVFGDVKFTPNNVTQLAVKDGDLNMLDLNILEPALKSEIIIVFGSSYIKPPLIDILVDKGAINIHMGVSPFYRGSSCNFWALYDKNPDLVGATVHKLSRGLDSGDILYHSFPPVKRIDGFLLGMLAVKSAHRSLVDYIKEKKLVNFAAVKQNRELEIRCTKSSAFTDEIAEEYLNNLPDVTYINKKCTGRDMGTFINPYILKE